MISLPKRPVRASTKRAILFGAGDLALWMLSYALALLIRFDGAVPSHDIAAMPVVLALFIPVKLAWHACFRLYRVTWDLAGLTEAVGVWKASTAALLTLASALFLGQEVHAFTTFPRSVLALDYVLGTLFIAVSRLGLRLLDALWHPGLNKTDGIRVLLVGAGAAGERIARSMMNGKRAQYSPIGFIDDDTTKHGVYVHGLKVLGGGDAIPAMVKKHHVQEVVITIPSAGAGAVREIMRYAREAGLRRVRVLPSLNELLAGKVTIQDIRDVHLEDLLGREPVRLDGSRVNAFLEGQTILVTGAGGSIGSELARQLSRSDAARLLLLDSNETALFELEAEIVGQWSADRVKILVADVRDAEKMHYVFGRWRPDIVYHAAAYKHVPLMEGHPDEAVRTNISGTLALAESALAHGSHTFVLISSDKAINPSGVMGATKRVAELLMKALNDRRATRFLAVRFGNVIGSRGSVIPILQEQIRHGGPVTITHPEMTRYFMSTREAVALVLQASALREFRDIFMLDMGRPIKIIELARELIRLSGLEPDKDIPIVFTGIRPGEKLHETLETPEEPLERMVVPGLFAVSTNEHLDEITLRLAISELNRLARAVDITGIRGILNQLTKSPGQVPAWFAASRLAPGYESPRVDPALERLRR